MGLIQNVAEAQIRKGVDDSGCQQDAADDGGIQAEKVCAVKGDVDDQYHVDGRRNAAGGPDRAVPDRHPLSRAKRNALFIELFFSCHENLPPCFNFLQRFSFFGIMI